MCGHIVTGSQSVSRSLSNQRHATNIYRIFIPTHRELWTIDSIWSTTKKRPATTCTSFTPPKHQQKPLWVLVQFQIIIVLSPMCSMFRIDGAWWIGQEEWSSNDDRSMIPSSVWYKYISKALEERAKVLLPHSNKLIIMLIMIEHNQYDWPAAAKNFIME